MDTDFGSVNVVFSPKGSEEIWVKIREMDQVIDNLAESTGASIEDIRAILSTIERGAEVNVQSDWEETDVTKDEYIKNKPGQSDWEETDVTKDEYIKNKPTRITESDIDDIIYD